MSKHEDWYIECILRQNDSISLYNITNIVQEHRLLVSKATIWHWQLEVDLDSYITADKLRSNAENIAKRLK